MNGKAILTSALAAMLLVCTPALAEVYINGEQVRGITNLTIENCAVTFNARGDIYITAPDYKVGPAPAMGAQSTTPNSQVSLLSKRYFLFTQTNNPGAVPLDFEVLVNGQPVKTITATDSQLVQELTIFLKPGQNTLTISSKSTGRAPTNPGDNFTIMVGIGSPNQGSLEIEDILLTYSRSGSDANITTDNYDLQVK